MEPGIPTGFESRRSHRTVAETVEALRQILHSRGITLFALVDHDEEATRVGLTMRPTKLLIFGNPKAGTPLMIATPSIAIDLPLKILVWEDHERAVWVSYNSPKFLQERHNLPGGLVKGISIVEQLASEVAAAPD
jgi:uncharacterized protein (DUF302 family)